MEKLNLSYGRKRVFKLKTFLILLFISLLPAVSFFSVSYQIKIMKISKLLRAYPEVFNNLSSTNLNLIEGQVDNLVVSLSDKEKERIKSNEEIRAYIMDVYRDTYFLRFFFNEISKSSNKFFLSGVMYDGQRFYIDYYEYGTTTQLSTETVYSELGKYYKDLTVQILDEKNFLGDIKYFHYVWEGKK